MIEKWMPVGSMYGICIFVHAETIINAQFFIVQNQDMCEKYVPNELKKKNVFNRSLKNSNCLTKRTE